MKLSSLQMARYQYSPKLPGILRNGVSEICVKDGAATQSVADQEKIQALFPNTYGKNEITFQKGANTSETKKQVVGVILSGGQAPGGHNVICGLYDALKATDKDNVLYGFKGGPSGLLENDFIVFDDEYINQYRNTGGFDIIGSGRTKLETQEQMKGVILCSFQIHTKGVVRYELLIRTFIVCLLHTAICLPSLLCWQQLLLYS